MKICQCHILYQLSPFPFQAKQRFLFEHQLNPQVELLLTVLPILAKIEDVARQTQESHKTARAKNLSCFKLF